MTVVFVFIGIFAFFVLLLITYLVKVRGYKVKKGGPPRMGGGGGFGSHGGTNP